MEDTHTMTIRIPFNMSRDELVPDPAATDRADWRHELKWLISYALDEAEVERVLCSTVLLKAAMPELPMWQCIGTAIIWERG